MVRILVVLGMMLGGLVQVSHANERESAEKRHAREAVRTLRRQSMLPSECEAAFQRFWRVYIGPGSKALVKTPALHEAGDYFGYGSKQSEPLLLEAEHVCARQTGARGDLVLLVLKERADRKWRRLQKLKHAERIIGY